MKPQNIKDLTKLIKLLKKNRINHIKIDDFMLSFEAGAQAPKKGKKTLEEIVEERVLTEASQPQYSETDTLFWSATAPEIGQDVEQ